MEVSVDILAARAKLRERFGQGGQQLGGKGTARRKTKKVHKSSIGDDKKLQQVLKRLGVSQIPGIEEVQMVKDDGKVFHFINPKVQASPAGNTYVVTGHCEEKEYSQMLPQLLQQLGLNRPGAPFEPKDMDPAVIRQLQSHIGNMAGNTPGGVGRQEDDDEVPDLVDNFEDVSKQEL